MVRPLSVLLAGEADVAAGPEKIFARAEELFDRMLTGEHVPAGAPLFGIGIGVPGAVEFTTGSPVSPPVMPAGTAMTYGRGSRSAMTCRYGVDNDVNLMALGELRAGAARSETDVIFVKIGTGIGAALISSGFGQAPGYMVAPSWFSTSRSVGSTSDAGCTTAVRPGTPRSPSR